MSGSLPAPAARPTFASRFRTKVDSFVNWWTGLGDETRDKRLGAETTVYEITQSDAEDLYRGDDLGAVVAEKLPQEMLRKGFEVAVEEDREASENVSKKLGDLGARKALQEALVWARVYGGGAVFLGVDDGVFDLSKPLDPAKVKGVRFLTVFNRWELTAKDYYADPLNPKYGSPKTFYLHPLWLNAEASAAGRTNVVIHESRLLIFDGVPVTRRQRIANQGWGDSIYIRVYEVLRDFNMTWSAAANLLTDWAQGIYRIKGLNELLASGDDDALLKRLQLLDRNRSVARAIVLDAGDSTTDQPEDFKRETAVLSGVPEILQQFALRLAAAARMPVTMLMGQSPAGLNATGENDAEHFDDQVAALQTEILLPPVRRLVELLFGAKDGPTTGQVPENWNIRFHPLDQLNDKEEADRRLKVAQADQIYLQEGVVTPEEVAVSRFGGDEYNAGGVVIDLEAREKLAAARAAIPPEDIVNPQPPEPAAAGGKPKPKSEARP